MLDSKNSDVLAPDTSFGRYKIVRLIGTGGMGAVYEATHLDLKKRVAIKILHPSYSVLPEIQARFLREGESASRIRHPHVVDVTDFGTHEGISFLVMEYLEGESLADLLAREGHIAVPRLTDIMLAVCAGVGAAHDEGVVHRDIKPDNIFLARSRQGEIRPKVVDFGISKVDNPMNGNLTGTGHMLGTPFYMSPEQMRASKQVDARGDQYALGITLYECATGAKPFQAETLYEIIQKIGAGECVPPRERRPEIPATFESVILRAMRVAPEDRFPSVRALGRALLPFATDRARVLWEAEFGQENTNAFVTLDADGRLPGEAGTSTPPGTNGSARDSSANVALGATALKSSDGADTPGPARASGTPSQPPTRVGVPTEGGTPATAGVGAAGTLANTGREIDAQRITRTGGGRGMSPVMLGAGALVLVGVLAIGWRAVRPSANAGTTAPGTRPIAANVGASVAGSGDAQRYSATIMVVPATAEIELDGQPAGTGAFERRFARDGRNHRVVVRAPGYQETALTFDDAITQTVTLQRDAPPPSLPGTPTPGTPTSGSEPAGGNARVRPGGNTGGNGGRPGGRSTGGNPRNPGNSGTGASGQPGNGGSPEQRPTGTNGAVILQ